jgi:uncharacterized membrane protein YeaQ/YmgE (transglycosylase-associated protein family)
MQFLLFAQDAAATVGGINWIGIIVAVVIGAIAGFLAGNIMKGGSMGLVPNIIVGIVGAFLFSFLFGSLNLIPVPYVNEILSGTIGAVILLFAISLFKKAT